MRSWSEYKLTASKEDLIFDAVRQGDLQKVLSHIFSDGDVNLTNHKGHSLLMLAAYNGHEVLTSLLLQHGADVNSRDASGNTILMGVAFKGHVEIAQRLLAAGADPHATNPSGQDALMFAEAFGREEMSRLLLAYKPVASQTTRWPRSMRWLRRISAFYRIFSSRLLNAKGA